MPRPKRGEDIHENHERWLVSYADFITLLFAFFVTMYALSSVNEGKYRILSDSLVQAFRNVDVNSTGKRVDDIALPRPRATRASAERRVTREKMRDMAQAISDVLAPLVREGRVRVTETANGISVEINASVLFASGEADLELEAVRALRAVAVILAKTTYPVTVEGHTDTTPIATERFPSNWELSVVRASSVVRLFVDAGVQPGRLTATGYGEQRPVANNEDAAGRARNRRVAILIDAQDPMVPQDIPLAPPRTAASASPAG